MQASKLDEKTPPIRGCFFIARYRVRFLFTYCAHVIHIDTENTRSL